MRSLRNLILFIALICLVSVLKGEVKLPHLISDGMILQRNEETKIWGLATPDETISVVFAGKTYKTKADKEGKWIVVLPKTEAGGPYDIHINNRIIKDVLFGDVWLCSGQSNMELPIRRVLDLYAEEVRNISNANIRLFRVPISYNFNKEEEELQGGEWRSVTPENILDFSAIAYFFAKKINEEYHVPIGLINTAVGGTPAEAWVSEETLEKYPSYKSEYLKCAVAGYVEEVQKEEQEKGREWHSMMLSLDKGLNEWNKDDLDTSAWKDYYLPGLWREKDINVKNSVIWFRKEFTLDSEESLDSAILRLGYIIDSDSAFVNGQFVGTTGYQYPPRIYKVPKGILKEGKNNIAIRVVTNTFGGFKEDKPYELRLKNRTLDLTGKWKYSIGAELSTPPHNTFFQYKPTGLFNGMIAPLTQYKIKGVLWYQGESNIGRANEYADLFKDLIIDWRKQWRNPSLPFIYAQLPELNKPWKQPQESGLAELREAQREALTLPYTGMAVTLGFGEWNDIHPLNKKDVSALLALEAQRVAYNNEDVVCGGPILEYVNVEGNNVILTFSSIGSGLDSNHILNGFTIAGADGVYLWADAVVLSEKEVKVYNAQLNRPKFVRYAWADNPQGANLKNREGLYASPFSIEVE